MVLTLILGCAVVLGFGFLLAGISKAKADKQDREAKLKRIQKEIARREAQENEE